VFVSYAYYVDSFKGTALTEDEFGRFGEQGCMYVQTNTLSRISDAGISRYPAQIQSSCKSCACALAEYLKSVQDAQNALAQSVKGEASAGLVKSQTAGAVSVTYDTSASNEYFLNPAKQEEMKQSILKAYLYPINIGGTAYNLLSKVIGCTGNSYGKCMICSI
jgi:hypothetical protein